MKDKRENNDNKLTKIEEFLTTGKYLIIFGLISIAIPLFTLAGFYCNEHKGLSYFDSIIRFTIDKYNFGTLIISFVLLAISIFLWMYAKNKKSIRELISNSNEVKDIIDQHLKKSKIVFESGIHEFDNTHLLALQRVLNALSNNVTEIIALDNTEPIQWWSDTMTGYLALLAKWKALDTQHRRRKVSRIFVFDVNELLSPIVAKTVTLHSLMGFSTYIYSKKMFDSIFDDFTKVGDVIINKKEFLIWDSPIENKISFELNEKTWKNVNCYQSFWTIDSSKYDRPPKEVNTGWKNYYGQDINSNTIEILFEFIAIEDENGDADADGLKEKKIKYWKETPKQYLELIDKLLKTSYCCKDGNEVRNINDNGNFGIEIKTTNCNNCKKECKHKNSNDENKKFDFTSGEDIKNILIEYYKNNKVKL